MRILHLLVVALCVCFSFGQTATGVGSVCNVKKEGILGKCRNVENCDYFKEHYNNGHPTPDGSKFIRAHRCAQGTTLVCCPIDESMLQTPRPTHSPTVPGRLVSVTTSAPVPVATQAPPALKLPLSKYREFFPSPGECGNTSEIITRIIGGQEAPLESYPWTGLVEYSKPNNRIGTHCGGTLITHRYFLTAAHCIAGKGIPPDWRVSGVRLGEWDVSTEKDCEKDDPTNCIAPAVSVPVEELIVHASFDKQASNNPNDIALIRLKDIVTYSPTIWPVCLPLGEKFAQINYVGQLMAIVGWGRTEHGHPSNRKLVAEVNVVDWHSCRKKFQSEGLTVLDHQMCAGGQEGIDSCNGDSGGGLFYELQGRFYTTGIISYGTNPCGQRNWPGVYTRVDHFIDWIKENIR